MTAMQHDEQTLSARPSLRVVGGARAVTLEDVATQAGVSKSTVSRALCDAPHVSSRTRVRIRAIAADLGYVPNDAARELAARRAVVVARLLMAQEAELRTASGG